MRTDQPTSSGEPQRPRSSNLLLRHWRGELPLLTSLFGIGALLAGAVVVGLRLLTMVPYLADAPLRIVSAGELLWLLSVALIWLWVLVGTWRSAARSPQLSKIGVRTLLIALSLGMSSWAYKSLLTGAEVGQIAFGKDPLGAPAQIGASGSTIFVRGVVAAGSAAKFRDMLRRNPRAEVVSLSSEGGRVAEAEHIARLIRAAQLSTHVSDTCRSACTIILLAGKERTAALGAGIGFHQATLDGYTSADNDLASAPLRDAFQKKGIDEGFTAEAFSTPAGGMWFPSETELVQSRFLTRYDLSKPLSAAAAKVNKRVPARIDAQITLERATASKAALTYWYKVEDPLARTGDPLATPSPSDLQSRTCAKAEMRKVIGLGGYYVYRFSDPLGRELTSVSIRKC